MDVTVIRYNEELTKLVKKVLGDGVVTKAYISTYQFDHGTEEKILSRLENAAKYKSEDCKISYGAETIVIQFVSGKKVSFSNSEWACIEELGGDIRELQEE